jgi:hypothetical protein
MRPRPDDGQLSLVGVVIALVVLGALTGIGLVVFVGGGSDTGGSQGSARGPYVGTADNTAAQQSLSQAQTAASTVGVANGYGSLSASALAGIDPNVSFTAGPSTASSSVSVAVAPAAAGEGGSLTLAGYARTGTCWYVWLGRGGPLYGAQTGQSACQAAPLPTAPSQGPASGGAAGWSSTGFPRT